MTIKMPAYLLQSGDVVGSGEEIVRVSAGVRTPPGKVDVLLVRKRAWPLEDVHRTAQWGKRTIINIKDRVS